jgi:hypothetical protein
LNFYEQFFALYGIKVVNLQKELMKIGMKVRIEDKIAYIIAVVNEFAARFSLNPQQAYKYLDRFKGIDFVDEFYNVEHTQSFDDVVDDLALLCRKNGGALA